MPLRILVIGSGAREHALLWKLAQSDESVSLYAAPGNAGTAVLAQNVGISILNVEGLVDFARREKIDFTIVGPDSALAAGVVDVFVARKQRIFGPHKNAAMIETSKSMAKFLMRKHDIPTAEYWVSHDADQARSLVRTLNRRLVLKADGLAGGKGVYRCAKPIQADVAIDRLMAKKLFSHAGELLVIEEWLDGYELSMHAVCSQHHALLFPLSQDYKRLTADQDSPNTGGMGAIAPIPGKSRMQTNELAIRFVMPVLEAMSNLKRPFIGCLYPGLIFTPAGPRVLEYNARFGDPETQVYMRLLVSDLVPIISAAIDNKLGLVRAVWSDHYAVNVVLATAGYPDTSDGGQVISGLEMAQTIPGIIIFQAGTVADGTRLMTTGGRTLSITATGLTMAEAVTRCYQAVSHIQFRGMQYRHDIGKSWLSPTT